MNSINNQITNNAYPLLPIKVVYFTKEKIIGEEKFFPNSQFKSILSYFNKKLKEEGKTKLKKEYIFNEKIIDQNEPLINFIKKKSSAFSSIKSAEIQIEIEKNDNIESDNTYYYDIIIQPKINPFGLYVFHVKEGIINTQIYPEEICEKYELDKYNDFCAYCNSPKSLFISGGKINDLPIKEFWIINNKKYSIVKKTMPIAKQNHSMIYLNINNSHFVFIAGGDNNLNSFYYNINNDTFEKWGDMNSVVIKPALYQYKHYLYSLSSFGNYNNYFEKTDISSKDHIWEKIFPSFEDDIMNFQIESFGVSSCSNDNILLVGGEKNIKSKTFIYDPINNFISLSKIGKNEKIFFSDKNFYQVSKIHNMALPSTLKTEKEIAVVNKVKQSVRLMKFNLSNGKSKVKFNKKDYGEIIIKINEEKRFGIQPKIVSEQNMTFFKNEPTMNEKEILKVELKPNINKNEEKIKLKKKNKNYIYLSSSVIYNNLIELIVQNNKIDNKMYENLNMEKPIGFNHISYSIDFEDINRENNLIDKRKDDKKSENKINIINNNKAFEIENNINFYTNNNKSFENKNNEIFNNKNFVIQNNVNLKYTNFVIDNFNSITFNSNEDKNEYNENDEERVKRDEFYFTIKEPLEADIIMIEDYTANFYDINNFADYDIPT